MPIHIREIEITNYKSFDHLTASDFGQINLITGKNNAGKTTFLEALYLCLGPANPALWLGVSGRRGLDRYSPDQPNYDYLFTNLETDSPIQFKIRTEQKNDFELQLEIVIPTSFDIESASDSDAPTSTNNGAEQETETFDPKVARIRQIYTPSDGQPLETHTTMFAGKIRSGGNRERIFKNSVYLGHTAGTQDQNAPQRYSDLDKAEQIAAFEPTLRIIAPHLKRTSLAINNDQTLIHADVGYGLVPVSTLGSGIARMTSLLLAIPSSEDAIVLIDEMETSFHHSSLEDIWKAVAESARRFNSQVFATTHSHELIVAAHSAFEADREVDFRLHKLTRRDGKVEFHSFGRKNLKAAIETGLELR
ncbi:MAG: AAA family ATPase [Chloroflexi bacterium]|nr:AAA family ATPase [Chloroflexota bacterium]